MPGRGRSRRLAALLAILVPGSGCGSSEAEPERTARAVHAWAATAHLTATALAQHSVPRVYARQLLEATRESRDEHRSQPSWSELPPDLRADFDRAIARLASLVEPPDAERLRP
jgi:hypothetical protein